MAKTQGSVFVSYAHTGRGKEFLNIVKNAIQLSNLEVDEWTDERIEAGQEWDKEIQAALNSASVAILYIDTSFLTRPYIQSKELPSILARSAGVEKAEESEQQDVLIVIPILVESVFLDTTMPWVEKLQLEPENSMRAIVDPNKEKYKEILTLSDLEKTDLARFTTELTKRLYTLPVRGRHDASLQDAGKARQDTGGSNDESSAADGEPGTDAHDWIWRYLARGDDLGSDHVDLHIVLSHSESSCYRVEVRYHYRQRQNSGFHSWKGYAPLSAEPSKGAPIQDGQHPGIALLNTRLELRGTQHSKRSTVEACIKEAKDQSKNMRVPLQLRIGISANAGELHYIPWETLPCMDGKGIIEQDDVVFSRTALPSEDEAVECRTRAQTALHILRVYSDVGVAAVDGGSPSRHTDIQQNITDSLSGFAVDHSACKDLLNPDYQLFLTQLSATAAFDVLYLACEGVQRGCEYYLRMEGGDLSRSDLISHFRQSSVPRIVILVSARQLEDRTEDVESTRALMHFAAMFSQLGTAGVVTCQQAMSANEWQVFLRQFSTNLHEHGHIPGAITQARKSCLGPQDNWKPVLLTRIKSTRVWYKPGFVSDKALNSLWEMLLTSLENESICPIIGPGIDFRLQQARLELARAMADEYDFPLSFSYRINLPAVAQYARALEPTPQVFVGKLKEKIRHLIAIITGQPDSQKTESLVQMSSRSITKVLEVEENNPYNILARLPINLYLTTNLDPSLEAAFKLVKSGHNQRFVLQPGETTPAFDYNVFDFTQIDLSKPKVEEPPNIPLAEFAQHRPLVVQFYGSYNDMDKAVVAEDDYLDFLATFGERSGDSKGSLGGILGSRDLIFLGFKWNSLEFRVLFRALQKYASGTAAARYHIAVQIDPDDDETIQPDKTLEYLRQYFSGVSGQQTARISLYWGSTEDFLQVFETKYLARYKNRGRP